MNYKVAKKISCILIFGILILICFDKRYIQIGFGLEALDRGGSIGQEMIVPSKGSGYYDSPFELTLSVPKGLDVFYTTDCSMPTKESIHYEDSILISNVSGEENIWAIRMGVNFSGTDEYIVPEYKLDKAMIVRAALFDGDRKIGNDIALTYFIGAENKDVYASLPILSIVCDGEDLFDENNGIYIHYGMRGKDWERFSNVTYFNENFQMDFSQNMGIRIRGGASREVAQKGFNLYARNEYGKGTVKNVFDESGASLTAFSVVTEYDDIKVKDLLPLKLSKGLEIGTMDCFPCNVFLNGEYWGIYFITERFDADYFNRHYNVEEKNVVMVKTDVIDLGEASDMLLYDEMVNFVTNHDMLDNNNYRLFSEMVYIDSLIDYYCFECYIYNQDWPYHNYALWRTKQKDERTPYGDGKWRFLLYDTNYAEAMNLHSGHDDPYLLLTDDDFIPYLMKNKIFRERFATRMCDMANIVGEIYKVEKLLDDLGKEIKESVTLSEERFYGRRNYDITEKLENDMLQFFYVRPEYILNLTKDKLQIDGEISSFVIVTDNPDAGIIEVNGLPIDLSYGSWEGKYYSGLEIKINACASQGYTFAGWEILSENGQWLGNDVNEFSVSPTGIVIKAIWE